MKETDEKYNNLARAALFNGLIDCMYENDNEIKIEKSEILKAFECSKDVMKSNDEEERYYLIAETVFETCIRLTRCLFFPMEARAIVLQGKEYSITAEQQLDVLRKNLNTLKLHES